MKITVHLIAFFACFVVTGRLNAQVSITINTPNRFQARVSDLFSAGIMNGSGAPASVYFTAAVKDKQNNSIMVSAKTAAIELSSGYTIINEMLVSPVYSYNDPVLQQTGAFSVGDFVLCLRAFSAATNEPLAEECIDFDVVSLSPPILLSPPDESEVRVKHPVLIWLAPTPIDNRMGVVYDLKLVQMYANQKPYDAIVRNPALIQPMGLKLTNLQYPAQAVPLEDDTHYAWKVIARLPNGKMIGETEVWSFVKRSETDTIAEEVPVKNYIELKIIKDANYVVVKDELKLVYNEKYGTITATIKISDAEGKEIHSEQTSFAIGENRYVLNLKTIRALKKNGFYNLEISAPDRVTQYLMFKNLK